MGNKSLGANNIDNHATNFWTPLATVVLQNKSRMTKKIQRKQSDNASLMEKETEANLL